MIKRGNTVIAIPPGETIREFMGAHEISVSDLSEVMEMTEEELNQLLDGDTEEAKAEITERTAKWLESMFGPSADFWLGLERRYRENLKKVEEELKDG